MGLAACVAAVRLGAQGIDGAPVHAYAPAPRLARAAEARGIALAGLSREAARREPRPGDALVCLIVLEERDRRTEWLVQLAGPIGSTPGGDETVLYGMDGRPIRFPAKRERYRLVALGPCRSGDERGVVRVRDTEVEMNAAFLDASLMRAAGFIHRTGRARLEGRLGAEEWFTVLPSRPAEPDPAARARFVDAVGMTDEDERAVAAAVPALNEFARVIAATPGLREVLFSLIKPPSLWSLVSRFGRLQTDFRFQSADVVPSDEPPLGFAGLGPCFIVPFTFSVQGAPALDCTILVVEDRPPLRMCGGIVALVAKSPERPDTRLIVRVLATRPERRG